ncbi:MAG: TetR/AcrR family transcriptional regulator [Myxococcales bacterium]|nr:TetR/AcrR family transcriptional regulator [Myxococcales bacterium]MDD9965782.1 TetR/AcrR family transcriptional regulator [Myxococcales bacterium]
MRRRVKRTEPKRKRVRRSPDAARDHILQAAIVVLAKRGPAAAGLKHVAREAGVSHALVTHYFGTYDQLVDAAVFESMRAMRTALLQSLLTTENPTPEAIAKLYLDAGLDGHYGRLLGWALFTEHERRDRIAEQLQPDMKLVALGTQKMLARRTDPPMSRSDTEGMIVALWSMVLGYAAGSDFFWTAFGRKPGPRRDAVLREIVGSLARAMFPEPPEA